MKQLAVALAFAAALSPIATTADLAGTAAEQRDSARCQMVGKLLDRNGLTTFEARVMTALNCQKIGGRWMRSLFYTA